MELNEILKEYRKKANMTQNELANKAGISLRALSNYEKGSRVPPIEGLIKISKALNILVTDLNPELKKDKYTDMFAGPGLYVAPKMDISEILEQKPTFTEDEIILTLLECYNDDIFNNKYDLEKFDDEHMEDLKILIRGILKNSLKDCIRNE